ncbi:NUDIX domain-containing protein, partial [bacterium]|nr:NUDIX domain-containing protein [bacterium]
PKTNKSKTPVTKSKVATKSVTKKNTKKQSTPAKSTIKKQAAKKKTAAKKTVTKKTPKTAIRKKATAKPIAKKTVKKATPAKKAAAKSTAKKQPVAKKPIGKKKSTTSKPVAKRKTVIHKSNAPEFPPTSWGIGATITFEATEHQPPPDLTCVAGGFVFYEEKLILANIPGRGWEIIGGRIDIGETPEETFRREAQRQIGVTFDKLKMLGVIRIEHTGPEPPNCPYPYPIGYGIQYIAIADHLDPFHGGEESLGRSLISADGLKEHYFDWNEHNEAVFKYAFSVYHKWRKKLDR